MITPSHAMFFVVLLLHCFAFPSCYGVRSVQIDRLTLI